MAWLSMSQLGYRVGGAEFSDLGLDFFGQFGCQLGSALIESSSPVSRSSSSSNYTTFSSAVLSAD